MQSYNFTKEKLSNKKVKNLEESIVRCQRFQTYFHHIICTKYCYHFDSNNPRCKYGYFPTHRQYSEYQVSLPLVIGFDETLDTKGSNVPVRFYQPGNGSEQKFLFQ